MTINIPEFSRSPYSLVVLLSVITGIAVAVVLMRRFKVAKQTIMYTCLLTGICMFAVSLAAGFELTSEGIKLGFSGLGGALGIMIGVFVSCLIFRDKPDSVMASFVCSAPLMYGLAKIGCLLAGCCHGKPYEGPLAVVYHGGEHHSYFPAQIIDMISFLLIFVIALILVLKMKNKVKAIKILMGITMPVRFALEYLRYYHDGSIIAPGQITVLAFGAAGIILMIIWARVMKINYR
jgi:prolipoprotein diacylglyceryltransferase